MFGFLQKLIRRDPIATIFDGNPSETTFSEAIHCFQGLPHEKQKDLAEKTLEKLNKKKINSTTLSIIIFCDFLSTTTPEFCFAFPADLLLTAKHKSKVRSNPTNKQEKEIISFNNFIYFYLQFL